MTSDLGKIIFAKLQEFKEETGGTIDINNIDVVVQSFMDAVKSHVNTEADVEVLCEIEKISQQIKDTKKDISNANPDKLQEDFPDAATQLISVTKTTEKSTNDILEAAEQIQAILPQISDEEIRNQILNKTFVIMESCSFQDLTGQRINKVVSTLEQIEKIVSKLIKTFKPDKNLIDEVAQLKKIKEQELLSGPQLNDKAPSQKDIDDLFNSI